MHESVLAGSAATCPRPGAGSRHLAFTRYARFSKMAAAPPVSESYLQNRCYTTIARMAAASADLDIDIQVF